MITRKNELKMELLSLHEDEIKKKIEVLQQELNFIQQKKKKLLSFPQKEKEVDSSTSPKEEIIPPEELVSFDAVASLGTQVPN